MSLTLYYHPLSSFCHKVLIALYENGTEFEKHLTNLGDEQERAALRTLWPLCKFPVIRDHARNRNVAETSIIIEYLDKHFAGKQPLLPLDWDQALQVRLWDRVFDNYVQGPIQEIVNDRLRQTNLDLTHARTMLSTAYEMIDKQLASRQWIVGDEFSMADCAAAPALFYASTLVALPEALPQLRAYFERLMARPAYARVLEETKPYLHFYPFAAAVPQRFR
jgi:glutathione S-transferase